MAAKPVTDQLLFRVNFSLLAGKAYVFNEMQLTIVVDTANQWENVGQLFFGFNSRALAGVDQRIPITMVNFGNNGADLQLLSSQYLAGQVPRTPMQTPDGSATINLNMSAMNLHTDVGAAGTVDFNISFFEYDLEQIQFFPVNWTQAVATR